MGEGDTKHLISVLEYGNSSLIRKALKANLVVFRCGCENGTSRVQGNCEDSLGMALPWPTDLHPSSVN
jgi:hypothetical protein